MKKVGIFWCLFCESMTFKNMKWWCLIKHCLDILGDYALSWYREGETGSMKSWGVCKRLFLTQPRFLKVCFVLSSLLLRFVITFWSCTKSWCYVVPLFSWQIYLWQTDKASILDEAIEYLKSLQSQLQVRWIYSHDYSLSPK